MYGKKKKGKKANMTGVYGKTGMGGGMGMGGMGMGAPPRIAKRGRKPPKGR